MRAPKRKFMSWQDGFFKSIWSDIQTFLAWNGRKSGMIAAIYSQILIAREEKQDVHDSAKAESPEPAGRH
jgi:hypothetical protein